ncbi:unnamed protein product [Parnassius apollo]|uniref:(apollo) hypothetical protein n=1 Tax=Parnassius apollo TaxID=110799 RepID=A0A8S3WCD6_PARAO|nr:unnamed protein product [Parnassius apollo]
MDLPVVVDSDDDEIVSHELEQMRSILEEAILETRSTPLENLPRLPRIPLSKRNRAVVRALNPMLVTYLEASRDLCETDSILFGAAVAVCRIIGAKLPMAGRATTQSSAIPAWRKRIEDRIAKARALIGRLTSFRSGNNRSRIVRTVRMAFAGTNISLSQPDITQKLTERIDDLKQKIAAWGKRIRRFTERSRRFNQNRLFQSDQKRLYKSLERPKVCGAGQGPDQADIIAFWRGLWSEPVNHSEGPWVEVVASQGASVTPMNPITITPEDVAEAVRRAPNWKSPGLDGLHHYWLKGFIVCHAVLARQFQEALDQKSLPSLFTTGITHLVPKDQDTTDPSKYRPITYLEEYAKIAGTQEKYNWIETTIKVQLQHINKIKPDPRNVLSTSTIKLLEQRNQLINTKDINDRRKHIAKISKDINESIRKDSKRRRMEIIEKHVIKTGGVKKANKELTNSKDWIAKIKNLSGEYSHHRKNILQIATSYYRKIYEHNIAQDEDDLEETSNVPNILMSETKAQGYTRFGIKT